MAVMSRILLTLALGSVFQLHRFIVSAQNSTFYNPILPGWNSDPSCTHVDGTTYCVTSTFIVFPGLPVYASNDLVNWKLVSHAWNRENQLPGISQMTPRDQGGMYAPSIRYHDGKFYVVCVYLTGNDANPEAGGEGGALGTVFVSSDPTSNAAWSEPLKFDAPTIDPDLFWDDDGKVYLSSAGIVMNEIDLSTGAMTTPVSVWNGTGGSSPEGPHVYKRNGWYYLMIAEGGTELGHMETIARSRNIMGPYEAYANNPILSNANTTQYFQTVGHADLFQDSAGLWWGVALATRSGPDWFIYPMGRETVLYPVTWDGEWPVLSPVRGIMDHAPLPPANKNVSGDGPFVNDPDVIDFLPGSSIPLHFYSQRYPPTPDTFQVSPPGHPNTLQVIPSRTNMTGIPCSRGCSELSGIDGISFISRKQTHTSFSYSVEMDFQPTTAGQEAGITVFRTQRQHIDLTLAHTSDPKCDRQLHFRIEATGAKNATSSLQSFAWPYPGSVLLEVRTANDSYYAFSAAPASDPSARTIVGYASGRIVSGGAGSFIGALLGVFSTCNGGSGVGNACSEAHGGKAWFGKWRYTGAAQKVDHDEYVPSWE